MGEFTNTTDTNTTRMPPGMLNRSRNSGSIDTALFCSEISDRYSQIITPSTPINKGVRKFGCV